MTPTTIREYAQLLVDLKHECAQGGVSQWLDARGFKGVDRRKILLAMSEFEDATGLDAERGKLALPKPVARKAKGLKVKQARPYPIGPLDPFPPMKGQRCHHVDGCTECLPTRQPRKPIARKVRVKKLSRKTLKRQCDKLWADWIKRDGVCKFLGATVGGKVHTACVGGLQAMHKISRRFHATRWDPENGIAGCAGVHMFYTCHTEAFGAWLARHWGLEVYEEKLELARQATKPDYREVLARLQALTRDGL